MKSSKASVRTSSVTPVAALRLLLRYDIQTTRVLRNCIAAAAADANKLTGMMGVLSVLRLAINEAL